MCGRCCARGLVVVTILLMACALGLRARPTHMQGHRTPVAKVKVQLSASDTGLVVKPPPLQVPAAWRAHPRPQGQAPLPLARDSGRVLRMFKNTFEASGLLVTYKRVPMFGEDFQPSVSCEHLLLLQPRRKAGLSSAQSAGLGQEWGWDFHGEDGDVLGVEVAAAQQCTCT